MILVTGAGGFIGRYVVRELASRGKQVFALTRNQATFAEKHPCIKPFYGDLEGSFELPDGVGSIYHCAGVISDSNRMEAVNIRGTARLIQAARTKGCKLIHLSSAGVVGPTRAKIVNEDSACNPVSLYESTKQKAEELVLSASKSGLIASAIRPTIVFGVGRDPANDSFLQLLRAIKQGRYRNIGEGNGVYNLVHAKEVARAMISLDESGKGQGESFFINTPIRFADFAKIVSDELNAPAPNSLPYPAAFGIALAFEAMSRGIGRKMPFGLSRLTALTTRTQYSQRKIESAISYFPAKSVSEYVAETCREYKERGLL